MVTFLLHFSVSVSVSVNNTIWQQAQTTIKLTVQVQGETVRYSEYASRDNIIGVGIH